MLNFPTALTVLRIGAIPAFVLCYEQRSLAIAIFIVAVATDALDGILARALDKRTALGAVLDPLADKGLFLSAYIMLALSFEIPRAWMWTVVLRDAGMVLGWCLVYVRKKHMLLPTVLGKLTNVFQAAVVILYLFDIDARFPGFASGAGTAMVLVTLASFADYTRRALRVMQ